MGHSEATDDFVYGNWKLHGGMCQQLWSPLEKLLHVFRKLEAAPPGSQQGIGDLSTANVLIRNSRSLLQHCTDSSKLYLAITGNSLLATFEKERSGLVKHIKTLEELVVSELRSQLVEVRVELEATVFALDEAEKQAGEQLCKIIEKDPNALSTSAGGLIEAELEAFYQVATKLGINNYRTALEERQSLKRLLEQAHIDQEKLKENCVAYLLKIMKNYSKQHCTEGDTGSISDGISKMEAAVSYTDHDISEIEVEEEMADKYKRWMQTLNLEGRERWKEKKRAVLEIWYHLKDDVSARVNMAKDGFVDPLVRFLREAIAEKDETSQKVVELALFNLGVNDNSSLNQRSARTLTMSNASPQVRRLCDLPQELFDTTYEKMDPRLLSWLKLRADRPITENPWDLDPKLVECLPSIYELGYSLGTELRVCSVSSGEVATIDSSAWGLPFNYKGGDRVFHGPGNGYVLVTSGLGIDEDDFVGLEHTLVNPVTQDSLNCLDFPHNYNTLTFPCNHICAENPPVITLNAGMRKFVVAVYLKASEGSWTYCEDCFPTNLCVGNKLYSTQENDKTIVFEIPSGKMLYEVDPPEVERQHPVYVHTNSLVNVRNTFLVEMDREVLRITWIDDVDGGSTFRIFKLGQVKGAGEGEIGQEIAIGQGGDKEGGGWVEEGSKIDGIDEFGGEGEVQDGGGRLEEIFYSEEKDRMEEDDVEIEFGGGGGRGRDAIFADSANGKEVGADGDNPCWIEMEQIGDEKIIFVHKTSGFSMNTPQNLQGNAIYFIMEDGTSPSKFNLSSHEVHPIESPFQKSTWFCPGMRNIQ